MQPHLVFDIIKNHARHTENAITISLRSSQVCNQPWCSPLLENTHVKWKVDHNYLATTHGVQYYLKSHTSRRKHFPGDARDF